MAQTATRAAGRRVRRLSGGGGGRGGAGDGGAGLPQMPPGNDLGPFLDFVHALLKYWSNQVSQMAPGVDHLDDEDRRAIQAGWADFNDQWNQERDHLMQALKLLQSDYMKTTMQHRGLVGSAMAMKWHMVSKRLIELGSGLRDRLPTIRSLWRKLLEAIDVILDSAKDAVASLFVAVVPGAGGIMSGITEFKDTALAISAPD